MGSLTLKEFIFCQSRLRIQQHILYNHKELEDKEEGIREEEKRRKKRKGVVVITI